MTAIIDLFDIILLIKTGLLMPSKLITKLKFSCILLFMTILLPVAVSAQKTVTGKLTNSTDKLPIPGATIQVKGTKTLTLTNETGNFSIIVPAENSVLQISIVGYDRLDVPVTGKTTIGEISMTPVPTALNDVVVTGYTTQRKKDITGAVSVVNVNNLKSVPSGTVESLLQGQAAGVTVTNNGAPGGPSNIRVRGVTSTGINDPLVIIDGTPGNLHDLNVNDIESIQVLKDAGAAAIYGVRGSNGVVVVTTKKGKQGRTIVTYDAFVGTQRPLKNGWDLANPEETANAIWQQYKNNGLSPIHKQYGSGANPVIPDYITPTAAMNGDPKTDPATYALYSNQITKANKEGTDWFHEIFRPAFIQSHNLSVSKGSDKSSFFFSLNYFDQDGTLIYTKLKRYSARINTIFNITDNIRVGENAYLFYKNNPAYLGLPGVNNANSINAAFRMPGIVPVYDIMGNFAGGGSQSLGNAPNPVAIMKRTADYKYNSWQMTGNAFVEADFLKHFTVRTSFGGTVDFFNNYAFTFTAYENAENSQNPNGFIENYGYNSSWTWTNTLKYSNNFLEKHAVNVLVGSEAIRNYGRGAGASRGNYIITNPNNLTSDVNLWTLNFGSSIGQANSNITSNNGYQTPYENSLFSIFGRLDYSYDDKYLLSGTLRRDGASVFASDKRYGVFPSVTAGWRISNESFMKNISWLNDLKIRGGWGKLGSISNILLTNPNNALDLYNSLAVLSWYDINGSSTAPVQGLYASQIGYPATTWEEDIITNIGLDATLFNNKIDFSFEWYKKSVSGLLLTAQLPATLGGARPPFVNSGDIQNKGIDAAITYHGKIIKDLSFDVTATVTSYNNKVQGLQPGISYIDFGNSRLQPGHPVGSFFGYKVLGLFQSDDEVNKSPTQNAAAPGRFKYADVNNDGNIDANDRTHIGNPNPDFTAGLNLGLKYKNVDLFMFFYSSIGNEVSNNVRSSIDFPQQFDVAISKDAVYNSWTPDRPNAKVPRLERAANFSNVAAYNSYYIEKGSFVRCKTLTLGYNLANPKLGRFNFEKARIYAQAVNIFTITNYSGLDPELPGSNLSSVNFGIDGGSYPANQPMYTIGVNVSF